MPALPAALAEAWSLRSVNWHRYALRLTRDPADAEDVVQEAVARTLQAGPDLPSEADIHRYVLQAVKTSALKLYRARDRTLRRPVRPAAEARRSTVPTPLDAILEHEESGRLRALVADLHRRLRALPPEQRQVVELVLLRDEPLKLREVAEIQGAPVSTVHSRLQGAVRKLAQRFAEDG